MIKLIIISVLFCKSLFKLIFFHYPMHSMLKRKRNSPQKHDPKTIPFHTTRISLNVAQKKSSGFTQRLRKLDSIQKYPPDSTFKPDKTPSNHNLSRNNFLSNVDSRRTGKLLTEAKSNRDDLIGTNKNIETPKCTNRSEKVVKKQESGSN